MDTTSARAKDGRLTLDLITEWFALLGPQTFSNRADFFAHVADNVTCALTPALFSLLLLLCQLDNLQPLTGPHAIDPRGDVRQGRDPGPVRAGVGCHGGADGPGHLALPRAARCGWREAGACRAPVSTVVVRADRLNTGGRAMNSAGEPPATVKGFKYDLRYAWVLEVNEVPEIISVRCTGPTLAVHSFPSPGPRVHRLGTGQQSSIITGVYIEKVNDLSRVLFGEPARRHQREDFDSTTIESTPYRPAQLPAQRDSPRAPPTSKPRPPSPSPCR